MSRSHRHLMLAFVLLSAATPICRPLAAEESPIVEHVTDDGLNGEFWLVQAQPEAAAAPEPVAPPRSRSAAARRRQSTYRAPSMFGDYFGAGSLQVEDLSMSFPFDPVNIPFGGGAVRRVKVAENNSPIPRDRFIFNYNFFNNVTGGIGDVNRYAFGFERTCFDESSSVQVMLPFASTLDTNQVADGSRATNTQFGDLSIIMKTILHDGNDFLIAGGLGLTAPLGDDSLLFLPNGNGTPVVRVRNDSVHLQPFLAVVDACESGFFWQGFMQLDVDTDRSPVATNPFGAGPSLAGFLQDQTVLFLDLGGGYWLTDPDQGTPAVAVMAELHYATALDNADVVANRFYRVTSANNRFDVLNMTLGANILVNESFSIRPAMVIPIAGGDDDQFDYEAMVQMNFWR